MGTGATPRLIFNQHGTRPRGCFCGSRVLWERRPVGAASRRDYAQDVRYIAIEHMDVRRDCVSLAHYLKNRGETPLPHLLCGMRLPHALTGGDNQFATDMEYIAAYFVRSSQAGQANAVTIGDAT